MEVGECIDFHDNNDLNSDYDWRIRSAGNTLYFGKLNNNDGNISHNGNNGNINCNSINYINVSFFSVNGHTHKLSEIVPYRNAVLRTGRLLDFIYQNDSYEAPGEYAWRIASYEDHLAFWHISDSNYRKAYISVNGGGQINKTITHNAPIENNENIDNFTIGKPVFITGNVYKLINENGTYKYISTTDSTNCIPSVKSSGNYKEFIGICVAIHRSNEILQIDDTIKQDISIDQNTIDFATHGDYYFKVDDSSIHNIGDIVIYDGSIIDDDTVITTKINSMIIGKITSIIGDTTVAVFHK